MLESVYQTRLHHALQARGHRVERETPIPLNYNGLVIGEAFRADLLSEGRLLIELKATEAHMPVHAKQVITYLRLLDLPLGLLMNFGAPTFKPGCRPVANNYFADF